MPVPVPQSPDMPFLAGGGGMGARLRAFDWSRSPLGPPQGWPATLRNTVALLLASNFPMWVGWGPEACMIYNDACAPMLHGRHPWAIGRPLREIWAEAWEEIEPLVGAALAGRSLYHENLPMRRAYSHYTEQAWFTLSFSPVRDEGGDIGGVFSVVTETTAQVQAERRLRFQLQLEERLRQLEKPSDLVAAATEALGRELGVFQVAFARVTQDADGVFWATIDGDWTQGSMPSAVGRYRLDVVSPSLAADLQRGDSIVIPDVRDDRRAAAPDAQAVYRRAGIAAVLNVPLVKAGRLAAILTAHSAVPRIWSASDIAVAADLAERTWSALARARAEAALRLSHERFRAAVAAVEGVLWTNDADGQMTGEQPGWAALTGQTQEQYQGYGWSQAVHPDDAKPTVDAWQEAVAERRAFVFEHRVRRWDGAWRLFSIRAIPVTEADGTVREWVGVHTDITDRRTIELALQRLNATLEQQVAERTRERDSAWRNSQDLLAVADAGGLIRAVNPAWTAILGWEEADLVGRPILDFLPPEDIAVTTEGLATAAHERLTNFEVRIRHKDGGWRWFSWVTAPEGGLIYGSARHITADKARMDEIAAANRQLLGQIEEREKVEATLRQMQRLEAVGQLTSGVAHDFNNLLMVISGNLQFLERGLVAAGDALPEAARLQARLGYMRTATERGAKLTAQLLAFSRRQRLEPKPIDLNGTVAGMADLLRATMGGSVKLETALAPGLWPALVDPTQIELAILNLAINARDAMEVGGRLTVATENVALPAGDSLPAGDYVCVSVTDTGSGMAPEVRAKAFEPFFTTKAPGRGSGLGLSQVLGFAQQSGGDVRLDTEAGAGTAVRILLPRAGAPPADAAAPRPAAADRPAAPATILLVDDDDAVREVTAALLADLGHRVIEAGSGGAGLEALDRHPEVALLLVDYAMPGMNGAEVAREARARRPDLPVVFVTGYADRAALADVPEERILSKPFRDTELRVAVEGALRG